MKCPKCGFVNFPGIVRCKKCGYLLVAAAGDMVSRADAAGLEPPSVPRMEARAATAAQASGRSTAGLTAAQTAALPRSTPASGRVPASRGSADWEFEPGGTVIPRGETAGPSAPAPREELAGRVTQFRRRRATLRAEPDSGRTLEFDFDDPRPPDGGEPRAVETTAGAPATPPPGGSRTEFDARLDAVPLRTRLPGPGDDPDAAEWTLESRELGPEPPGMLISAVSPWLDAEPAGEAPVLPVAPVEERLMAGLADVGALLVAAAVFALIFWKAGGSLEPQRLDVVVVAFMAGFFSFVYFALFGIFTFQTPGEAWRGLALRNLDGNLPALSESLWRACGYVVSASALTLGFVWALLDSDGLGWHDRMSRTYLVSVSQR